MVTREESINLGYNWFTRDNLKKCLSKTSFVCSHYTDREIVDFWKQNGYRTFHYRFPEQEDCRNVGMFAIHYAHYSLGSDQIFLIGMENEGAPYDPYVYDQWERDFWFFVRKMPVYTIINCSEGGRLYDDNNLVFEGQLDWIEEPRKRKGDVLIIGGAPSLIKTIHYAKKFKGTVCVVDSISYLAVDKGVHFDYLLTLEKCTAATEMLLTYKKHLDKIKDQFTLVYAPNQQGRVGDLMTIYKKIATKMQAFRVKYKEAANIGLFSIQFAEEFLMAKRIFLIGYDHYGTDVFGNPYEQWIYDKWLANFRDYLNHGVKAKIINCSPKTQFRDNRISYGYLKDLKNK